MTAIISDDLFTTKEYQAETDFPNDFAGITTDISMFLRHLS